jgi:hypothetical protein
MFLCCFFHFGAIRATPNELEKVPKGLQLGRTYGAMSKLENKPLTQIIRPILSGEIL